MTSSCAANLSARGRFRSKPLIMCFRRTVRFGFPFAALAAWFISVNIVGAVAVSSTTDSSFNKVWTIENNNLLVTVHLTTGFFGSGGSTITVKDKAANHTWSQPGILSHPKFTNGTQIPNGIQFYANFTDAVSGVYELRVTMTVPSDTSRQVVMTAAATDSTKLFNGVDFIEPFAAPNTTGSRLMITDWCSGHLYPSDLPDANWPNSYISDYDATLLQLPLAGVVDIDSGLGYSVTLDTPDNANMRCLMLGSRRAPMAKWRPTQVRTIAGNTQGVWGYDRQLTFNFTPSGGHVALAKAFRSSLPAGTLKTLTAKTAGNGNTAKLLGAPLLWDYFQYIDSQEAYTLGVTKARHFVHTWGDPLNFYGQGAVGESERLAATHSRGWLTSEYGVFADAFIVDTEAECDWRHELSSNLLRDYAGNAVPGWSDSDGQQYMRCPSLYVSRATQRLGTRQGSYPVNSYYLDVTPTRQFFECFDANHPRSCSQYRADGQSLLQTIHEQLASGPLVTAGEGGKWWQVPYLDAPLGLMSVLNCPWNGYSPTTYRQTSYPDGTNYNVSQWDSYENYGSLGHKYRAPLWELVFHDCVVSDWYPNDSVDWHARTTGLPFSYQKKKDALNVLYGAVPTFCQIGGADSHAGSGWFLNRADWLASYRNACKPHERLGDQEMLSHQFIAGTSSDVQQTTWADGTVITVNFGTSDHWVTDRSNASYLLRQFDFLVDGNGWKTVRSTNIGLNRSITTIELPDYRFSDSQYDGNGVPVAITTRKINENQLRVNADDNGTAKTFYIYPKQLIPNWNMATTRVWLCDPKTGERTQRLNSWITDDSIGISALTGWVVLDIGEGDGGSTCNDFDGDRRSDVVRLTPGSPMAWTVLKSSSNFISSGTTTKMFGDIAKGDVPVSGDFDGDSLADYAFFRPTSGDWHVWSSRTDSGNITNWGYSTDIPKTGDWDGDGITDMAVFRPYNGLWAIRKSNNTGYINQTWGQAGDIPLSGDYDGDGKTDFAVYRPGTSGTFLILCSNSTTITRSFGSGGLAHGTPIVGDFDGDGISDFGWLGGYKTAYWGWGVLLSSRNWNPANPLTLYWGDYPTYKDLPAIGDYDGDGKTDFCLYRQLPNPAEWYIWSTGDWQLKWAMPFGAYPDLPVSNLDTNYSPIKTWKLTNFASNWTDSAIAGDLADPDYDTIPNLLEYALTMNPNVPNGSGLPTAGTMVVNQSNYLTLTYTHSKTANDLNFIVEVSNDLQAWNSGSYHTAVMGVTDNGSTETIVVRDLTPIGQSQGKRFIRLKVKR